jgi:hypothetical protein
MDETSSHVFSRRRLLALSAALPVSIAVSCTGSAATKDGENLAPSGEARDAANSAPPPEPTPAAPPFVIAAGEEERAIMAGTRFETPLYVFGSGRAGAVALVLGGVHGNEPGGWLAADRVVDKMRPDAGALLVVPHTNKVAMGLFERTTDEIGDVNRSYPGSVDGKPGQQIAAQIMDVIREFHVGLVVDMHESWAFYKDRPQNGTAFLGQTVATNAPEPGPSIARGAVEALNSRIQSSVEEFFFRDRFGSNQAAAPGVPNGPSPAGAAAPDAARPNGVSSSSLGIPNFAPGVISILVEIGQQQALERRIALHVDTVAEFLRREGVLEG